MAYKLITADIGGTNSRFALFSAGEKGEPSLEAVKWMKTKESESFGQLIENLRTSDLLMKPEEADIVVVSIAGPVEQGVRSSPPFISWSIDISSAGEEFGFKRSALINDFVAQAFACRSPVGEEARMVLPGDPAPDGTISVIGAGTGLGKAALRPDGKGGYTAMPSEGGHAGFSFVSRREFEFQEFVMKERGDRYITGNTIISGGGLSYVHQFLTGKKLEPRGVSEAFAENPETLEWVARFFGRAFRNYALETLAQGGLYIAGGVAAKSPEIINHRVFEEEFRSSDTMAEVLSRIPVFLITDENSGLWGAAMYGLQILRADAGAR
jgi:glucokinase